MFQRLKIKVKVKSEFFLLFLVLLITVVSTGYHNYSKKKIASNYKEIVENIYFKKTLNHIFNKFEPRFKKISHKIELGDTFDSILNQYSVKKEEIIVIKKNYQKK